jgi:hypothetical protein
LVSSTLEGDCFSELQVQTESPLKQFTNALHNFVQKFGTHSAFAFVVVIAFQVFALLDAVWLEDALEHSTPIASMFKNNGPEQRPGPLQQ